MQAVKGLSMDKWLCWGSMAVSTILLVLFALDLFLPTDLKPFGGLSAVIDVLCILASGLTFYLAFDAYRDVR
jgi:hypothetical protein